MKDKENNELYHFQIHQMLYQDCNIRSDKTFTICFTSNHKLETPESMADYREAGVYGASLTEVSATGSGPSMAGFITVMNSTL